MATQDDHPTAEQPPAGEPAPRPTRTDPISPTKDDPTPAPSPQPTTPQPDSSPPITPEQPTGPSPHREGEPERTIVSPTTPTPATLNPRGDSNGDEPAEKLDDPLEVLEPYNDPQYIWIVGKPPDKGGEDNQWSRYVQRPLGYMAKMRFYALVADSLSQSMRESGGGQGLGGLSDMLGDIPLRGGRLNASDFADAGSFVNLAMRIMVHVPDFLLECYCIWLEVPGDEKFWAKTVMDQPFNPENDQWGLAEDDGIRMVEIFIDQNYEDIRRFFAEKLPKIAERVQAKERDRESTSAPSKQ